MNRAKLKNNLEIESDDSNNSSHNQMDLSLLRKPIKTSVEGFEEVLRAYEAGTNEIKKLLSKECDLIYECKVCRNIFRSLTNFISHKRVYCRSSFNSANHFHFASSNGFAVQDISTIIQAEQKSNSGNPKPPSGSASGGEEKTKDLSGIVEHLLWKQHQSRTNNVSDFYSQIQTGASSSNHEDSPAGRNQQTLMLNRVNDSDVAVFQSILTQTDNSHMRDEINEVHNLLKNNNTVLGPDGKVINLFNSSSRTESPALSETSDVAPYVCQVCNIQFETQKMLKVHVQMKHLPSSKVYQCPSCAQQFSSSAAVIRHLSNDHKKSNRRIRLMRDNIIKKAVRADEIVSKAPTNSSREVQKLQQLNGADSKDDTIEWNEHDLNGGGIYDNSYTCPSCLKKFDRKAVYTSHVQQCTDTKDREIEKMKKRKAKDGTKTKNLLNSTEIEESSNMSGELKAPDAVRKRKRSRTVKVKTEEDPEQKTPALEDSNDIVDWNLDDEEEKQKIENIKKDIIEDEYKKVEIKVEPSEPQEVHGQEEDEDSGLIIDEKADSNAVEGSHKCPQCDKVFETEKKLQTHLTCYHSRQKRFRCKICDYQGYRKKDTLNHLNFVHQVDVTIDKLFDHVETVNKAVNEAEIAKQKEIKKGQTKLKRQLARQMQRKKESSDTEGKSEFKAPEIPSVESTPTKTPQNLQSPPMQISPTKSDLKTSDDEEDENFEPGSSGARRKSSARACKNSSTDISPESNQRPIRNRVKPVNNDFLYDLRDLLKKEQEAHRELSQGNVSGKRELRKRAMSTNIRETFETHKFETPPQFILPSKSSDAESPAKNRRMSVFVPSSSRPMYTPPMPTPRSPVYKPPPIPTHKNAGVAYRMALKASEQNKASLYEPKYIQIENYGQKLQKEFFEPPASTRPGISAASSILKKLSGGFLNAPDAPPKTTTGQLCKQFESFNVANELDIPRASGNNLMELATANANVCVLQEISADSTDFNEDDSDSEPKLEIQSETVKKSRGRPRKNPIGKSAAKGQPRLTVFQRLQENKIRKTREQLFHQLLQQQSEDGDDEDQEEVDSSVESEEV